jgi:hypothetical protein
LNEEPVYDLCYSKFYKEFFCYTEEGEIFGLKILKGKIEKRFIQKIEQNWNRGKIIKTCLDGKYIIANVDNSSFEMIDPQGKSKKSKIFFENVKNQTADFAIYGPQLQTLVFMTFKNPKLYGLSLTKNFKEKKFFAETSLRLSKSNPKPFTLAVCPKHTHLCVHIVNEFYRASKIVIFKIQKNSFEFQNFVDIDYLDFSPFWSLNIFGYFGNFLIVGGVGYSGDKSIVMFAFNFVDKSLKELDRLRCAIDANGFVFGLEKWGKSSMLFVDGFGRICKTRFVFGNEGKIF